MTEDEALLAAIAAHPDEDTPRLAYADWLDEHDRPLRAELIRVQCAIAALDAASIPVRNRNVHLWKRQQDLLEFHREDLLGPLADVVKPLDAVFERGFLTEATLDATAFVSHGQHFAEMQPLPSVRVYGIVENLEWLVACESASKVISILEIRNPNEVTFESPPVTSTAILYALRRWNLKTLKLEGFIGDIALGILLREETPTNLASLTSFDLSYNELTDVGLELLVNSALFRRLLTLILFGNRITDRSAHLLAEAPGRLRHLNVASTAITVIGQQVLLRRKGTKVDLF